MRKVQFTILAIIIIVNLGRSQTLNVPDNIGISSNAGNVGIGTATPYGLLEVKGNGDPYKMFRLLSNGGGGLAIGANNNTANPMWNFHTNSNESLNFSIGGINTMFMNAGKVGIGTINPSSELEVKSVLNNSSEIHINTASDGGNSVIRFQDAGQNTWGIISNYPSVGELSIYNYQNNTKALVINPIGNIGIGTTTTGSHKLAVEGTIGAREIKVEAGAWSDFVFYEDYELKDLEEVESFIKKNNHLPDIPSEQEVKENGIQVGEMNAKLLQKIEELTLYMIEQNKKTDKLVEEMQEIKNMNELLNEEINTLKTQ